MSATTFVYWKVTISSLNIYHVRCGAVYPLPNLQQEYDKRKQAEPIS